MSAAGSCLVMGVAKSGTTALLHMVRDAFGNPPAFFEEPISSIPEVPAGAVAKVIFEHEAADAIDRFARRFRHRVMLLRDPRDNAISRLLYAVAASPALLKDDAFLAAFVGALRRKQDQPASVDVGQLFAMLDRAPGDFTARALAVGGQLAAFQQRRAQHWHVVRYEAMVAGDLAAFSDAIGRPVAGDPAIDPAYARVTRTHPAGDWRHWFTRRDAIRLRPTFAPLLHQLGYDDDWERSETPAIQPEHSWQYVLKLISERRRHYGLPPFCPPEPSEPRRKQAAPPADACNICGGTTLKQGPHGRMSRNGRLPACLSCGSLERQRILRAAMHAMPLGLLSTRSALAFGKGIGLQPSWFRSWDLAAEIAQHAGRADGSVDFILVEHALEYVEDDRLAFEQIVRLLSPHGVLLVAFAESECRAVSEHFVAPAGASQVWHRYGGDLVEHFRCAERGLGVLRITLTDPCTGTAGELHLFFKDRGDLAQFRRYFRAWDPSIAVQAFGAPLPAGSRVPVLAFAGAA